MKNIVPVIALILIIVSCQKSQNSNPPPPPTFTFLSGDTAYDWSGNDSIHNTALNRIKSDSSWWLDCRLKNATQDYMSIGIQMKNLAPGDYSSLKPIQFGFGRNGNFNGSESRFHNDQASFVITSLHDNLVDGTFSYVTEDGVSINVTHGIFKNVPVHVY
jgi:hypothetical protein